MEPELEAYLKQREALEPKVSPAEFELAAAGGEGTNTVNRAIKPEGKRRCPICGDFMKSLREHNVGIDACAAHGVWLDSGELELIVRRSSENTRRVAERLADEVQGLERDAGYYRRHRRDEYSTPEAVCDLLFSLIARK